MENKMPTSKQIEKLYAEGKTDVQIAQEIGCEAEVICAWRKARKLPSNAVKNRKDLSNLEKEAVIAREMGLTYGQYKALGYRSIEQPQRKSKKRVLDKTWC